MPGVRPPVPMPPPYWPRAGWVLGLLTAAGGVFGQAVDSPAPLQVTQVNPGVYVHLGALEDWAPVNGGDVANIGFVVGSRCVAVIDTGGTPGVGRALRAAIERTTPLPVCYVINSHAHPDHMLGNVAFNDAKSSAPQEQQQRAPQFVASAAFTRTLKAREPFYLNALRRDFGIQLDPSAIVYPGINVDKTLELDLGNRVLTLQAWPTAHTDNDLTVYDQRTHTLFASDLLFVQHLPAVDGSLRGWISVMADLKRLDVATVVPGHGAVSNDWPAVKNLIPIQQAIERIGIPAGPPWLLTDRFHRRNVTAAYAELEWEDEASKIPETPETPESSSPASR